MKKTAARSFRALPPVPAIKLGGRAKSEGARYGMLLVIFMRLVALLWIVEGLAQWTGVLTDDTGNIFAAAPMQRVSTIFLFCILDLIAAVGLWLVAPWGGVVWIVTIGGQIVSLLLMPGFWSYPYVFIASDIVLVALYLGLTWCAVRESESEDH